MQYPSIEAFGKGADFVAALDNPAAEATRNHLWYIQEKIDGSNLSMRFKRNEAGEFVEPLTLVFSCRSHNVDPLADVFAKTCERLNLIKDTLNPNYVYHGEAVRKARHNVAEYARIPRHYFVCFDIYDTTAKVYLDPARMIAECDRVQFEHVRFYHTNDDKSCRPDDVMKDLISRIESGDLESMLGGVPEGVVLKHERFWYKEKYISAKRKLVTKKFKECQRKRQQKKGITADEFLQQLGRAFAKNARFAKAKQHLDETRPSDALHGDTISKRLMVKELNADFDKEYRDEIMVYLWQELGPLVKEASIEGLDEWISANTPAQEVETQVTANESSASPL
jgi:hypothetical protein